jgi:hypothetical protein
MNNEKLTIKDIGCVLYGIKEEIYYKTGHQLWQDIVKLFEDVIKERYPNNEQVIKDFKQIVEVKETLNGQTTKKDIGTTGGTLRGKDGV